MPRASSFERSARGWKVQSKPSRVLPVGRPESLRDVATRRSSLRSISRCRTRSRKRTGAMLSRAASLDELGQDLGDVEQFQRGALPGDRIEVDLPTRAHRAASTCCT